MNWIFYKGRWYLINPIPFTGEYKLSIPGKRGCIFLNKNQLKRAIKHSIYAGNELSSRGSN